MRRRERLAVTSGPHDAGRDIERFQRGVEPFTAHPFDDRAWSIERARGAAIACGHERFECAAEHLRVDGRLAPRGRVFPRGDAIPGEQSTDEFTERLIGEAEVADAPLERRSREEADRKSV